MKETNLNILSFDVEDGYQGFIKRGIPGWEQFDFSEEKNINIILELLAKSDTKATFFVLGKFAEKNSSMIKKIKKEGHEIASHSYSHIVVPKLTPEEFRADTRKSKLILEDIIGETIIGYRAPKWSLNHTVMWAFEILAEEGFQYDSSIFPSNLHEFGDSHYVKSPLVLNFDRLNLVEFPAGTLKIFGVNIPAAGGFYFRAYPYFVSKYAVGYSNKEKNYSMVYLHPFEFDENPPRIKTGFLFGIVRYYNLNKTKINLEKMINHYTFTSIKNGLKEFKSLFNEKRNIFE